MNLTKPRFGMTPKKDEGSQPKREKLGAVWHGRTKTTNKEYLTVVVELTPDKLKELAAIEPNKHGKVVLSLVAYTNSYKEEGTKQPDYNIYERVDS